MEDFMLAQLTWTSSSLLFGMNFPLKQTNNLDKKLGEMA
jgi:hypothetical protein